MGWKNGKYYHRSKRIGDRVTSEYVGSGLLGELAEQIDEHERQQAEAKRRKWHERQAEQQALDNEIDGLGDQLQAFVDAMLVVNGYHKHKRQWRKQRGSTD